MPIITYMCPERVENTVNMVKGWSTERGDIGQRLRNKLIALQTSPVVSHRWILVPLVPPLLILPLPQRLPLLRVPIVYNGLDHDDLVVKATQTQAIADADWSAVSVVMGNHWTADRADAVTSLLNAL